MRAPTPCSAMVANARSNSRSLPAFTRNILSPSDRAADSISLASNSVFGLPGFTSMAIVMALGATSRSTCSRFGPSALLKKVAPVILPPGRLSRSTTPSLTGSPPLAKTIGNAARRRLSGKDGSDAAGRGNHRYAAADEIADERRYAVVTTLRPAVFDQHAAALDIAGIGKALAERIRGMREFPRRGSAEEADDWGSLLRKCAHWPRRRRAPKQRDELAPPHSITSSARASSVSGISSPSILAVSKLMTSSNFVGCSTGRSAGFVPFNILST